MWNKKCGFEDFCCINKFEVNEKNDTKIASIDIGRYAEASQLIMNETRNDALWISTTSNY